MECGCYWHGQVWGSKEQRTHHDHQSEEHEFKQKEKEISHEGREMWLHLKYVNMTGKIFTKSVKYIPKAGFPVIFKDLLIFVIRENREICFADDEWVCNFVLCVCLCIVVCLYGDRVTVRLQMTRWRLRKWREAGMHREETGSNPQTIHTRMNQVRLRFISIDSTKFAME